METEGTLSPETPEAARAAYDELVPAAKVAVRETARAMDFDRAEYRERVTGEVIETVRDALFASLLRVHVGTRAEFDEWIADHPGYEPDVAGSENVERVAWHPVPFADAVVATTFAEEREAAIGTLRRRAFGRVYRDHLPDSETEAGPDAEAEAGRSDAEAEADGNDGGDPASDRSDGEAAANDRDGDGTAGDASDPNADGGGP